MSKRTILMTIDANEKTCGKCEWRHGFFDNHCVAYSGDTYKGKRLPECLEAEKRAKGVKK